MKKLVLYVILGAVALFVLIQLAPYGRNHTNPPVVQEPAWASPEARQVAQRACFDCHSNETVWPWYSNIAPVSWLVQHDTEEGRSKLNFSEWTGREELDEIAEVLQEGEMPMPIYLVMHSQAKLSSAEVNTLLQGLGATAER
ncbi:MAG: heme-binding domain-containing protein [Chloroflexota bacterium]